MKTVEEGTWEVWAGESGLVNMAMAGNLDGESVVVVISMTIEQTVEAIRALEKAAGLEWVEA